MDRPSLSRLVMYGAAGGALAGCINACHALYAFSDHLAWHIVPAGALHGALLACLSLACAWWLLPRGAAARWTLAPAGGYLIGYATYLPLALSAGLDLNVFLFSGSNDGAMRVTWPLMAFGLVALVACLAWGSLRLLSSPSLALHLAVGSAAGVLGSLWWWNGFDQTWFALPHGILWGCCAGFGAWKAGWACHTPDRSSAGR